MQTIGTIREFNTPNFRVTVDAINEDYPDLSWDKSGETTEQVINGDMLVFAVRAYVTHKNTGITLGECYLGNCVYSDIADFQDHPQCAAETRKLRAAGCDATCGSYFSDMVRESIANARGTLADLRRV